MIPRRIEYGVNPGTGWVACSVEVVEMVDVLVIVIVPVKGSVMV
jgi:hypothetical protein